MEQVGIELNPNSVPAAYGVCSEVWNGRHPEYVASMIASGNPEWFYEQAQAFVALAILIYCPPEQESKPYVA